MRVAIRGGTRDEGMSGLGWEEGGWGWGGGEVWMIGGGGGLCEGGGMVEGYA